ncbi:hypothetical protein [Tuwongella immobilis]|uniref:Uncharacterized protein n=1 Tax=Tuwongella immobilis TaxID=692036 RepID=A0A6C2YLT5_9BACT|nr:hypothetical protein [Tuwongella immobilis]VIP02189.1 Uncharacterized protein OS=Acetonema longum DSM 6540 GN=ALO_16552 PE=4 SV=1 [Tuwongella immobilis]VTS00654.1 Uncharacterized protein OS=Acetonema longum DSM 6540 GN=ALO_16552 PE=4 SV=1 [Tuwongella immobilis]
MMDFKGRIAELDHLLRQCLWADFRIESYIDSTLTLGITVTLSQTSDIIVRFEDPFFVSLPYSWTSDTSKQVAGILEGALAKEVNPRFRVEMGTTLFFFHPEDYDDGFLCLIGASSFSWAKRDQ